MEFEIRTDLTAIPEAIAFNFEEMKAELTEKLNYYNALVVTEDSIKEAKSDKAKLNKLRTAIEDKRKEVKKLCLAPYEDFEKQCKELVSMVDEPIQAIDTQIKVFDEKEQLSKWQEIALYYNAEVKELAPIAPLEKIISPKWKNKTEDITTICNGIGDTLDRIRNDLETIKGFNSEFESQMKDVYLKDYNLSKAIAEQKRLEEQKKQLETVEKAKEPEQKKHEVLVPISEEVRTDEERIQNETENIISGRFAVTTTVSKLIKLRDFMKENEIKFEVIQ